MLTKQRLACVWNKVFHHKYTPLARIQNKTGTKHSKFQLHVWRVAVGTVELRKWLITRG